jgi:murein L,D-transpeptidase YcbB/YkuD
MSRTSSLAACALLAAALTPAAPLPLRAQTAAPPPATQPASEASSATGQSGTARAPEASAAAAGAQPAPEAPASATATNAPAPEVKAPVVVEVDPLVAEVRRQLAASLRGNIAAADRAAVTAYYGEQAKLIWVTKDGLTPRARHAMAEIAKAGDWGLVAGAFELPRLAAGETALPALADAEIKLSLAVLKYARHARGGRLEPLKVSRNFDHSPALRDPKVVLESVAATDVPGDYLRDLHPRHVQFQRLQKALLKLRGATAAKQPDKAETVRLPDGPVLKLGVDHPQVALLRQRLKVATPAGSANVYDQDLLEAVAAFQRKSGLRPDGVVGSRTRAVLNGAGGQRPLYGTDEQRIIVNMERWRWLPEDLGEFYVWDNVPEFQTRVVKRGQVIHQAKIIVGRAETQTALFSANMRYVIFGPEWGVPDSIKVKEILPYLRPTYETNFFGFGTPTTDTRILERHNLRVSYNGRPVDASQIDWTQVDIRKFNFIQPSGPGNVLGAVKFRFPNKHDIYMHDTPQRELFEKSVRMFSHGCIRVHNPGRLAEVLLGEDKGWSAAHVRSLMAQGGNNEVTLTKQIPVHITYFTAMVGDDGELHSFPDVYGHDNRVALALAGRPLRLEPPPTTSAPSPDRREARRLRPFNQTNNDFFSGLFGN